MLGVGCNIVLGVGWNIVLGVGCHIVLGVGCHIVLGVGCHIVGCGVSHCVRCRVSHCWVWGVTVCWVCHEINDPLSKTAPPPGLKTAIWTCCNRSPVAVKYLPKMPTLKTQISKFDGTVTELEKNLGLHDGIQAYLQLEYASGVAKAAIFKNADLSV